MNEIPRKRCVCCGEIIPLFALNCKHCRSWVALWEGSISKEYFYLLAAALTCVFGTLLPWKPLPEGAPEPVEAVIMAEKPVGAPGDETITEPAVDAAKVMAKSLKPMVDSMKPLVESTRALADNTRPVLSSKLKGIDFMSGAVIFFFSVITVLTCLYNIRTKRLLFWPILQLLVINLFILAVHYIDSASAIGAAWESGNSIGDSMWRTYRTQGLGMYFVSVATLFILLQILMSVFKAAGKEKEKKAVTAGSGRGRRR